jgi:uncharacterized protein YdhG (YjbR/CyaY superfamily)
MSEAEVTEYIQSQDEPKRSTLEAMRKLVLEVEPNLEQVVAWKSAMLKFNGKFVTGLCAHKAHISFSPQSAEVMEAFAADLADYVVSKSSFQFAVDQPLPKDLVAKLVKGRLAEVS